MQSPGTHMHIDDTIIQLQQISVNSLAYAIRLGRTDLATTLIEQCGASIDKVYSIFEIVGKTPIDSICENGYLHLLRYWLPLHLNRVPREEITVQIEDSFEALSIFDDSKVSEKFKFVRSPVTAVQRACEMGHLHIIREIQDYFRVAKPPMELDVNAENEKTGENCGLIACRTGHFEMVKLLHEECKVDFTKLNKRQENAVQLVIIGSNQHPERNYYQVLMYLIEEVKVDITYRYEESLLLADDNNIIQYIEEQLKSKGILDVNKRVIDEENMIKRVCVNTRQPIARVTTTGPQFSFLSICNDYFDRSSAYISSIAEIQDGDEISLSPL